MSVAENLERLRNEVADACARAQRAPADVALMAVSKMHPVQLLLEAHAAGQRLFGENRVQEWQQKAEAAASLEGLEMHLIGPLQSNKSARAAELFHAVDTVDSLKIATRLNDAARALNKRMPIYIEVKLSYEESKHGLQPQELPALLDNIAALDALIPIGLMTVPPWPTDIANAGAEARPYFQHLRGLRDASVAKHPTLTGLSMGMSNDFAAAIEEGSTCVRIGDSDLRETNACMRLASVFLIRFILCGVGCAFVLRLCYGGPTQYDQGRLASYAVVSGLMAMCGLTAWIIAHKLKPSVRHIASATISLVVSVALIWISEATNCVIGMPWQYFYKDDYIAVFQIIAPVTIAFWTAALSLIPERS